jgi:hypothetical protein
MVSVHVERSTYREAAGSAPLTHGVDPAMNPQVHPPATTTHAGQIRARQRMADTSRVEE